MYFRHMLKMSVLISEATLYRRYVDDMLVMWLGILILLSLLHKLNIIYNDIVVIYGEEGNDRSPFPNLSILC